MTSGWTAFCIVAFTCVLVDVIRRCKKAQPPPPYPLPPGPPPFPIIGNLRSINAGMPWLTYTEWSKVYGGLVYSRIFSQDIITINSEKIAKALFEDRSSNYADRPRLITNDLYGVGFNTVLLPYGDKWRLQRRFFHQTFKPDSVSRFTPMQQRRSHLFARQLLKSPENVFDFIHQFTTSVIMNAIYDYDPVSPDDYMVEIIRKSTKLVTAAVTPEVAGVINAFPIILSLPSWFPGMGFKRWAALSRQWAKDWVEIPFEHAMKRQEKSSPAMVFDGIQDRKGVDTTSSTQALKDAAATGLLAASETSNALLSTLLLAMVLNPAVQHKAYVQVKAVVGKERLPTLSDRPFLPYIDAIICEAMRWHPVAPLVPHAAVNDDVYEGYRIPKGATVIANVWAMCHDESNYAKPFEFIPERFLHPDGSLTSSPVQSIGFGFGRRICVGRHFADISVWFVIATVLALWKLSLPKDEDGNDVPFEPPKWADGATTYPLPFPCVFQPRISDMDATKLEELIQASV